MRIIENECVGCPPEMGCMGSACPYCNVERFYCDKCKEETTLHDYYGLELCENCILKQFPIIEGSEY